ncbi:hypothetical protein C8R47DRAFT_216032 [Mycena vitilis]|nr:hypothetical protein C8R47DRAFT_216032 [Mycena vitilis]
MCHRHSQCRRVEGARLLLFSVFAGFSRFTPPNASQSWVRLPAFGSQGSHFPFCVVLRATRYGLGDSGLHLRKEFAESVLTTRAFQHKMRRINMVDDRTSLGFESRRLNVQSIENLQMGVLATLGIVWLLVHGLSIERVPALCDASQDSPGDHRGSTHPASRNPQPPQKSPSEH